MFLFKNSAKLDSVEAFGIRGCAMKKLLIANRGEIARRVLRSAIRLGFEVGVLVADDDIDGVAADFVTSDCRIRVPSYLDIKAVVAAAKAWGAHYIHPGYGFLSERAEFAAACSAAGITFVGPTPEQMRLLGDKENAKRLAMQVGVPTLQAAFGAELTGDPQAWSAQLEAKGIVSPWLIKASGGGGGRGMRVVHSAAELPQAIERAAAEALAGFGNPAVFIERFLNPARHIEIQVFGDGAGGGVALGERECSLQRRHQKVVEEAPSPVVHSQLRQAMCQAALRFVKETAYRGAGTVEFLLAPDGGFHFLEVNTRLQVEHPVTEIVCGVDLVDAQLFLAQGIWPAELGDPKALAVLEPKGHAIEVRILAEDPLRDFAPTPGTLVTYVEPAWHGAGAGGAAAAGVGLTQPRLATAESYASDAKRLRLESALIAPHSNRKVRVNPNYDSMVAKLIGSGPTRFIAAEALRDGLRSYVVSGFATNIDFLQALLRLPEFDRADFHTRWIETHLERCLAGCLRPVLMQLFGTLTVATQIRAAMLATDVAMPSSYTHSSKASGLDIAVDNDSGRASFSYGISGTDGSVSSDVLRARVLLSGPSVQRWASQAIAAGREKRQDGIDVTLAPVLWDWADGASVRANVTYNSRGILYVNVMGVDLQVDINRAESSARAGAAGPAEVLAPMPGKIVAVIASEGQAVTEGAAIFVLESMKMQIEIKAPRAGIVFEVATEQGHVVEAGLKLCGIKENDK
jgi:acetyl/propionyl-CoA carboxylase alpha subunit